MHARFKLSEHRHTGRRLPHSHTSYPMLGLMLMLCGILLTGISFSASAAGHPPPQAGSISLSGSMPAPPPGSAPVITSPHSGQHFSETPVTVTGSCPSGDLVEIYENDIFAGAGQCNSKNFSIDIGLLYGSNTLVARSYDALDQSSPDSNTVTVSYDVTPPQSSPLDFANLLGNQLLLRTSPVLRGAYPGVDFALPAEIIGGTAPYSLSIDWGDGKQDLLPKSAGGSFDLTHKYDRPGTYRVTIKAADAGGQQAFLEILVIVNGQAAGATSISSSGSSGTLTNRLLVVWPLYLLAVMLVIGFWLGEKREKAKLEHQGWLSPA